MVECANPRCSNTFPPRGPKAFCHRRCRLRSHRAGVRAGKVALPHRRPPEPAFGARVLPIALDRPASFHYADPAYPGKAHLYPENQEVDHEALIRSLVELAPDGWALSTSSEALRDVLPMCPRGVRVCSWKRQHRPYLERAQSWEPVLLCGGRRTSECVPDSIVANVPPGWDLPGRKPERFYLWLFALLGMGPADAFFEPFPGSGSGAEAFEAFRSGRTWETFRRPSRDRETFQTSSAAETFPELGKGTW